MADKRIIALEKEILDLEKEKEELEFISRTREHTGNVSVSWQRGREKNEDTEYIFRVGPFDRELLKELPDYESKWKGTVYDLHPDFCHEIITGSFRGEDLYHYIDNEIRNPFVIWEEDEVFGRCAYYTFTDICIVNAVFPSPKGNIFVLSEPYGTVVTEPLQNIKLPYSIEDISGKTIIVCLKMCREKSTAIVEEMKELPEIPFL